MSTRNPFEDFVEGIQISYMTEDGYPRSTPEEIGETDLYIGIPVCSCGDYSPNGSVGVANFRDLQEFCDEEEIDYHIKYYHFSGREVLIDLDQFTEKDPSPLVELMGALADYPLISDDTISQVEMEMVDDQVGDKISDIIYELEKDLEIDIYATEEQCEQLSQLLCSLQWYTEQTYVVFPDNEIEDKRDEILEILGLKPPKSPWIQTELQFSI